MFNRFSLNQIVGPLLGLNLLVLQFFAGLNFYQTNTIWPVGASILAINCITALLLLSRQGFVMTKLIIQKPYWLFALFLNGALFKAVQPLDTWGSVAEIVFVAGTVYTIYALFCLGKRFSIAPTGGQLVQRGAYSQVRHPAYAGELLMAFACVVGKCSYLSLGVFFALVICQVLRILVEEHVLSSNTDDVAYLHYSTKVKWRLVPCIW